jgi:hypothetical protein
LIKNLVWFIIPKTVEFICQGTPKEMGFAQGVGAKDKILGARKALANLEAFRLLQPRVLPYRIYHWLAEQKAARFLAGLDRDQCFKELLDEVETLSVDELGVIMADHGSNGMPSDDTLCVHSSYWNTTACLQFFPRSRRLRVAYSAACRARYEEIEF